MSMSINSALFGMTIGAVIGIFSNLKDLADIKWRNQFLRQITEGLSNGNLEYEDIQHIAERWSQDRKAVLFSLRVLLSKALSGDEAKLKDSCNLLRQLLRQHEQAEPYAELPENISIQLTALSASCEHEAALFKQLATSLSELYSSNQRQISRQSKLAFWSVVIGMVGIAIGVVSCFK